MLVRMILRTFQNALSLGKGDALGSDFKLYGLRRLFAAWMISQGVPESVVNTIQGPPASSGY
ncbi:hypothetical protein GCM10007981_02670 [Thermocladium modestius]|uniref:Uncharacterized protein n=1 Tax=Thermocladium modestius TaxID=62609 RepID=A0A830GTW3_9CREN|nr:hypothetical protein GCM10007981_02670 [Thermocladium modestius]